jgi:hypothetical protein
MLKFLSRKFLYPIIYIALAILNRKYDLGVPLPETAGLIGAFVIGESVIDTIKVRNNNTLQARHDALRN